MSVSFLSCTWLICLLQICDFGLAKWKEEAATQTTTGDRRGTVAYMAPEVFRDANSPRTVKYDVYSFGILLWEILSEKTAFENGIDIHFFAGITFLLTKDVNALHSRHYEFLASFPN